MPEQETKPRRTAEQLMEEYPVIGLLFVYIQFSQLGTRVLSPSMGHVSAEKWLYSVLGGAANNPNFMNDLEALKLNREQAEGGARQNVITLLSEGFSAGTEAAQRAVELTTPYGPDENPADDLERTFSLFITDRDPNVTEEVMANALRLAQLGESIDNTDIDE